jgi:hypothetical protein
MSSQIINSQARAAFIFTFVFFCVVIFLYNVTSSKLVCLESKNSDKKQSFKKYIAQLITTSQPTSPQKWTNDFLKTAKKYRTDKVKTHSYHHLYGMFLGPIRFEKLCLLEIGLGCGMSYPPGASAKLWKKFLPNASINFLEFNKDCAAKFEKKVDRLYIGDQSDFELLSKIATENKYDVIIDDGGHTRKQQIHSLIGLWPGLKPNGMYIIEDMSND